MVYETPEAAALGGAAQSSDTRVVASVRSGDDAAVLLDAPGWPNPDLVVCHRDGDGWREGSSTSGRTVWLQSDGGEVDRGTMASWTEAEPGATAAVISFADRELIRPVDNGFVVWMVDGVTSEEAKASARLEWVH